jgi:hypothetical protein
MRRSWQVERAGHTANGERWRIGRGTEKQLAWPTPRHASAASFVLWLLPSTNITMKLLSSIAHERAPPIGGTPVTPQFVIVIG